MTTGKTHNCIISFLLSAILLCVVTGFSANLHSVHKIHKEINAGKGNIKTVAFFSELEEDDECEFNMLKSLPVYSHFYKCKIAEAKLQDFSAINSSVNISYNNKEPIYVIINVFRI